MFKCIYNYSTLHCIYTYTNQIHTNKMFKGLSVINSGHEHKFILNIGGSQIISSLSSTYIGGIAGIHVFSENIPLMTNVEHNSFIGTEVTAIEYAKYHKPDHNGVMFKLFRGSGEMFMSIDMYVDRVCWGQYEFWIQYNNKRETGIL